MVTENPDSHGYSKSRKKNLREKRRRLLKAQNGGLLPRRKRRPKAKKNKEGNIAYLIYFVMLQVHFALSKDAQSPRRRVLEKKNQDICCAIVQTKKLSEMRIAVVEKNVVHAIIMSNVKFSFHNCRQPRVRSDLWSLCS